MRIIFINTILCNDIIKRLVKAIAHFTKGHIPIVSLGSIFMIDDPSYKVSFRKSITFILNNFFCFCNILYYTIKPTFSLVSFWFVLPKDTRATKVS